MAYQRPEVITDPMPTAYCDGDEQWINAKLNACADLIERIKVCEAYSKAYGAALKTEPLPHKCENVARRAANQRLRVYIHKKFRVFNR